MAKLGARWPMRFCSGERARRRRCSVGTGEAAAASVLRAVEEKERQMEQASASGRRAGCSSRGQQRQDARGVWQHEQESGDGWHTCGVRCLMTVSHCRSHSDNGKRLTARLHRFNMAKSLVHCKNSVHEKCRSTIHLQFLFKDHHLICHGSEVTSSQSWLDPTENAVRT